ncbi:hypothetical protein VXO68_03305 [Acinetobacter oleivorans]|uniref:hypothetical protein n=1 Tax=Acinetobacter oleivorans TaxID=1148157 RepID=UPI003A86C987
MPQFLLIAESIYEKSEEEKLFSEDIIEHLNRLVSMIRQEIKDTSYKLKYNFIDFEECLNKPENECSAKLDISLMPTYKNKGEYIMWLASFIEKITLGGREKFPPLANTFLPSCMLANPYSAKMEQAKVVSEKSAQMIVNYFRSSDYKKINKVST